MCEETSAFNEFILESAENYLQTVVLIDDRIYESTTGNVASHLAKPLTVLRKSALKSADTVPGMKSAADKKAEDTKIPEEVSFHDVQNSFAKKRIICSLYQPKKEASFGERSDVYRLCSAADVVIVDWDLHGDSGAKATALVGNLIEQSMKEIPHQLRLVLIYTMEVNLRAVADKIYEDLVERIGKKAIDVNATTQGLVLATDNARVVVLGKRENTSLPEYAKFWVPEKKLAERTIDEFSRLASGLLQAVALRGVANLRENNRRILMRFHERLDVAFLAHRALLLPDEVFGQIIPLLADEMRAVLEDTLGEQPLGRRPALDKIIADWCDKRWKPDDNAQLKIGVGADPLEFAKDVFCNGPEIKKDYSTVRGSQIPGLISKKENEPPKWKEKQRVKLAEYLAGDHNGDTCHEMLSTLMSQRTAYESASRALHLGVILKEVEGDQRYMLCLQPVCDSVRINGKTLAFIFCFLEVPEAGMPFTHALMDISSNPIHIDYRPKAPNCYVSYFAPGADAVCATKDDKGRFIFEDEGKTKYEWIAELKTEHAQRAAEEFARTLSRVGLTESEWLRLKAK
jgi:hypothetical protein